MLRSPSAPGGLEVTSPLKSSRSLAAYVCSHCVDIHCDGDPFPLSGIRPHSVPQPCREHDKIPTLELNFCLVLLRLAVDAPHSKGRVTHRGHRKSRVFQVKAPTCVMGFLLSLMTHINVEHGGPKITWMTM